VSERLAGLALRSRGTARRGRSTLLALGVLTLIAAACSSTDAPSASARVIDVALTDAMRIEPGVMTVPANAPVLFVITNTGSVDHEFFLGDEAAQAEHEAEMAHGGMSHDEPSGVMVPPGQTRQLAFTFSQGEWLAGCHVPGHYPAGMKAVIEVEP
jgi:uncharacterized cupredoxin-like copper-binding protein